jgi:hypothetical protein
VTKRSWRNVPIVIQRGEVVEFFDGVLEGIVLVGSVALVAAFMALLTMWRFFE